jgi:hypothetical protein
MGVDAVNPWPYLWHLSIVALLALGASCTPGRGGDGSGSDDDDGGSSSSWASVRGAEERGYPTDRLTGVAFRYTFDGTRYEQVITTDGSFDCEDVRRYFSDGIDTGDGALAYAAYLGLPAWEMIMSFDGWVDVDRPEEPSVYLARRLSTDEFFVGGFSGEAEVSISERNESRLAGSATATGQWLNEEFEEEGEQLDLSIDFDLTRCNPAEYELGDDDDSAG